MLVNCFQLGFFMFNVLKDQMILYKPLALIVRFIEEVTGNNISMFIVCATGSPSDIQESLGNEEDGLMLF